MRKASIAQKVNEPEVRDLPILTQEPSISYTKPDAIDGIPQAEYDLMRLMILYGPHAVETEYLSETGELHTIESSVIEVICHDLDMDELTFDTPLFSKIHQLFAQGLAENELYKSSVLKRQEDQEIVQFVSSVESNEQEISLNWLMKYNIQTTRDVDKLNRAVPGAIYAFKLYKIEKRINEIRKGLNEKGTTISDEELNDLVSEQIALEKIKREFSQQLGRTILR